MIVIHAFYISLLILTFLNNILVIKILKNHEKNYDMVQYYTFHISSLLIRKGFHLIH